MKKILLFTAALAALLSAASCQKEEMGAVEAGNGNVTFTIQTPEDAVTKAIGDGTNVNIVYYEIYKNVANHANSLVGGTPLVEGTVEMEVKKATLTLNLLEDQEYVALFWAQVDGKTYYDVADLRKVEVKYNGVNSNDEARAAFYQRLEFNTSSNVNEEVTLVRPFAQLNIGHSLDGLDLGYTVDIKKSEVTVTSPARFFNVNTATAHTSAGEVTFALAENPTESLVVNNTTYEYAAMNYFLVEGNTGNVDVVFDIETDKGTVSDKVVAQVPVKMNYRTNLLGNLLTKETKIEIVVDEKFADEELDGGKFGVIDGQYYVKAETSDEFYAAVADEDVDIVILTGDVVLNAPVTRADVVNALTVSEGETLTIDLAGHTLSWTSANRGDAMIMNYGELKLVGDGNVVYTYTGEADSSYGKGNYTIVNSNKLIIDGPTVENATAKMSHASYAVHNAGDLHIKSGKVLNTNNYAIRLWIGASKATSVVMDGGVVEGTRAVWAQLPSDAADAPVHNFTMNGGQLIGTGESEEYKLAIYSYNYGNSLENVSFTFNGGVVEGDIALTGGKNKENIETLNINGGTFNGGVYSYGDETMAAETINIKGGTFATEPYAYCLANGYKAIEADGKWNVIQIYTQNENEYTLLNAEGLMWFAATVNAGDTFAGKTIKIGADIDLTGKAWTPISSPVKLEPKSTFRGVFDGMNYTVKNMTVTNTESASLFGYIYGATIKNVTIEAAMINSNHYAAGIVGWVLNNKGNQSTPFILDNCHVKNTTIKSTPELVNGEYDNGDKVGGLVGYADFGNPAMADAIIKNCSVENTSISAYRDLGGLVGYAKNVVIENCTTTDVTVTQDLTNGYKSETPTTVGDIIGRNEGGNIVDGVELCAAKIGDKAYMKFADAIKEVQTGETIKVYGEIAEGTIKLPATLKNVTFKGEKNNILKDMTISAADGNSVDYEGLTFDGITFENSNVVLTGWRTSGVVYKDITVTNCTFRNVTRTNNEAAFHINCDDKEVVNGFVFTNNVIDGVAGASNSGLYAQLTGEVLISGNVINNVAFRPYVIQITTDDGINDTFTVTGNTFSGSAVGRAQGLGNNDAGTDTVTLKVSENIFKDITNAQQICYWNFNSATTTAVLSHNYYDIDIAANPSRIYYNSAATSVDDLVEMGVYPIYTELNADGTINKTSLFTPQE